MSDTHTFETRSLFEPGSNYTSPCYASPPRASLASRRLSTAVSLACFGQGSLHLDSQHSRALRYNCGLIFSGLHCFSPSSVRVACFSASLKSRRACTNYVGSASKHCTKPHSNVCTQINMSQLLMAHSNNSVVA